MDYIEIKRPVVIKVIMTPEFRGELKNEAETTLKNLDENLKVIEDEGSKQIRSAADTDSENKDETVESLETQLSFEKDRIAQMQKELATRIDQLETTKDGDEFPFRIFEGSVQIKVGDNLLDKVSKTEVVVKDWKVVEIRNI